MQAVKSLYLIFSIGDNIVSMPFIHSLAPKVMELACENSSSSISSDEDVDFLISCIGIIELLVSKTVETYSKILIFCHIISVFLL